jgi:hypothetical protein
VETFEEYPQLGRFTLRDEGKSHGRIVSVNWLYDDGSF